jgi:hypothetical protein
MASVKRHCRQAVNRVLVNRLLQKRHSVIRNPSGQQSLFATFLRVQQSRHIGHSFESPWNVGWVD